MANTQSKGTDGAKAKTSKAKASTANTAKDEPAADPVAPPAPPVPPVEPKAEPKADPEVKDSGDGDSGEQQLDEKEVSAVILKRPHTHKGKTYVAGTPVNDIKGLTPTNIQYMQRRGTI